MQKNSFLNRTKDNRAITIFSIFLGLAYSLPFHTNPLASFYNELLAIWGVVVAFAFLGKDKNFSIQLPWIALLPLSIAGIIALQMAIGTLKLNSDSLFPIACFVLAGLAIILGASLSPDRNSAKELCMRICFLYIVVGFISVVIASFQLFAKEAFFAPFMMLMRHFPGAAVRPVGNIGQTNHLALLFCFGIASTWWLYRSRKLETVSTIGLLLVFIWGLVITQSRVGWLILPVFGLLAFIWRDTGESRKVSGWAIFGFLLLYGAMVSVQPSVMAFFFDLSATSPVQRMGIAAGSPRLASLREAWQISLDYPWFGAGWNLFGAQQLQLEFTEVRSTFANHSHNIILNFAAELGWPVTIVATSVFAYWLIKILFSKGSAESSKFCLFFLLAVLIHSMVEFPLWYAYFLLPFALLMGVVHHEQFSAKRIEIPNLYPVLFFAITSAALLFAAIDYRGVMRGFDYLNLASMGFKLEGESADKPKVTIFPQFYDYFRFAQIEAKEKMSSEEIAFMENTYLRFGELPNVRHMAFIYSLNERPAQAIHALSKIKQLHRCAYTDLYPLWEKHAKHQPEIFGEIYTKLPQPDFIRCGRVRN